MPKMIVTVNGATVKSTSRVNEAFNFAGDRAAELARDASTPLGTTVVVLRDGAPAITRTLVEVRLYGGAQVRRDWRMS